MKTYAEVASALVAELDRLNGLEEDEREELGEMLVMALVLDSDGDETNMLFWNKKLTIPAACASLGHPVFSKGWPEVMTTLAFFVS